MAPLYQRFFIILFLLLAFAGRIVVYANPVTQIAKEVIKKSSTDETDKSSSSEKQNQLEEKVKLTDLDLNKILKFEFSDFNMASQHLCSGNFLLAYCHLQVPEQPPK